MRVVGDKVFPAMVRAWARTKSPCDNLLLISASVPQEDPPGLQRGTLLSFNCDCAEDLFGNPHAVGY